MSEVDETIEPTEEQLAEKKEEEGEELEAPATE